MFGVGMPELMIIFVIALLVFGPKELPKIARTLGKAMSELRRASDELRDGIQREIDVATREEKETPSSPPEAVPSSSVAEGSFPSADVPGGVGAEAQGTGTAAVDGSAGAAEPGSQQVTEATPPALDGQADRPVATEAVASSEIPAEPAQVEIAPEEVLKAAAETAPPSTPKEAASAPETVPHVPAHPAETRHA